MKILYQIYFIIATTDILNSFTDFGQIWKPTRPVMMENFEFVSIEIKETTFKILKHQRCNINISGSTNKVNSMKQVLYRDSQSGNISVRAKLIKLSR